jgi:hypothetical protein
MNNQMRTIRTLAAALSLVLGTGAALAMGPGPGTAEDRAEVQYRCSLMPGSTGATAKSPQRNRSYSCAPLTSVQTPVRIGATAAKTPSRSEPPMPARVHAAEIPAGPGCGGTC